LLIYVFLGIQIINKIPIAALSVLLIYIGWKLCEPRILLYMARIGNDQLLVFVFTIVVTLFTDLLIGVIAGVVFYLICLLFILTPSLKDLIVGKLTIPQYFYANFHAFFTLFASPIYETVENKQNDRPVYIFKLGTLTCFNISKLEQKLQTLPHHAVVDLQFIEKKTKIIDYSAMSYVHYVKDLWSKEVDDKIIVEGVKKFERFSTHHLSSAYNKNILSKLSYELGNTDSQKLFIE